MWVLSMSSNFIRNCVCECVWWEIEVSAFLMISEAFHELEYFETTVLWKCWG